MCKVTTIPSEGGRDRLLLYPQGPFYFDNLDGIPWVEI
jgi:hypothetical protein